MRRAINNISSRQGQSLAIEICKSLRQLQSCFQRIYVPSSVTRGGFAGDLNSKMEVMKASVAKVENACYNMHVRGSEKPDGWGIDIKEESRGTRQREGSDEDDFGRGKRQRIDHD
jgi:Translin family